MSFLDEVKSLEEKTRMEKENLEKIRIYNESIMVERYHQECVNARVL